jgi:hypothetical protein
METYQRYIILTSLVLFTFYIGYLLMLRKERNFKFLRLYLLSSMVLSLILPFNKASVSIQLPFSLEEKQIPPVETEAIKQNDVKELSDKVNLIETQSNEIQSISKKSKPFDLSNLLIGIYLFISIILLIRLLVSSGKIFYYYHKSSKVKMGNFTLISIEKQIVPFSFFNFIFIDKSIPEPEIKQIIEHEKVHARQYHTIDLLFSEIFVAIFWFNPFAWMIKKALQQVHEFLADEGVIKSGFDKLSYQALLVNQASEDRLVKVSSNFSYSLIKKRIMMLSEKKTPGRKRLGFIAFIPVAVVFLASATNFKASEKPIIKNKPIEIVKITPIQLNKTNHEVLVEKTNDIMKIPDENIQPKDTIPDNNVIAVASPVKMNVFYIGVDNPVSIAVSGISMERVTANIGNGGSISGENGNYIVRVKGPAGRFETITIYVDGKVVSTKEFRVKKVPDPVPTVGGIRGGIVDRSWLSRQTIKSGLENFDFDLNFEVVSFNITTTSDGIEKTRRQEKGNTFTTEQCELMNEAKPDSKIYVENVMVKAPDGTIRNIGGLTIQIK